MKVAPLIIEETMRERKYRLILETELYDLPPPSAADRVRYSRFVFYYQSQTYMHM
jgi:hypothetical protein